MIYHKVNGIARHWAREIEIDIMNGDEPSPCAKAYAMVYEAWQNGLPEPVVSSVTLNNGWISCTPNLFNTELRQQSLDILDSCGLDHSLSKLITRTWLELTKSKFSKKPNIYSPDDLNQIMQAALAAEDEYRTHLVEQSKIKNRVFQLAEQAGINLQAMYMAYQAAPLSTFDIEKAVYDSYVDRLVKSYDPKTDKLELSNV